jgi:hypothetical protein
MRKDCSGEYSGLRGGNYTRNLVICTPHPMCSGNQSRKIRWAGNVARMERGEVYTGLWWGNLREEPGVDRRIMLRWIFRKWDGGMVWIDLVQNRDRWRVLVNAVMNFGFHKMWGIS